MTQNNEMGLISKDKMTSLANAVRQATNSTGPLTVDGMTEKLGEIGGEPPVALRCYDYEGTIVGEYDMAEVMAMTELPACPDHTDDGLVSQGWNWTLASIKEQLEMFGGPVYIGAVYITDDGATRLHLDVDILDFYLGFGVKGTAVIDWGDGSPTDTVTGTATSTTQYTRHTYAQEGRYVISISGGEIVFNGAYAAPYLLTKTGANITSSDVNRYPLMSMLRGINTGSNIKSTGSNSLYCTTCLDFVTLHNACDGYTSSPTDCYLPFCVVGKQYAVRGEYTNIILSDKSSGGYNQANSAYCDTIPFRYPPIIYPEYKVPEGTTEIPVNAFSMKKYKRIELPDTLTAISNGAFLNCTPLTELVIPDTVTSIDIYAFNGLPKVTELSIPEGITSLSNYVFGGCKSLREFHISDNVTSIGNSAFNGCYALKEIEIPESVTTIGTHVFNGCYSLRKANIPENITTIGASMFQNCYSLQEIELPRRLSAIDSSAFQNCYSLKKIINKSCLPIVVGGSGSDYGYLGQYATEIIGNFVTETVGGLTIRRNTDTHVYMATGYDGTTPSIYLGDLEIDGEMNECITITPNTIFQNKNSLTSVTIDMENVSGNLFQTCKGLTTVVFSDKIRSLRYAVFNGCSALRKVDFTACVTIPTIDSNLFNGVTASILKIVVPDALYDDWRRATNWTSWAKYIVKASEYTE